MKIILLVLLSVNILFANNLFVKDGDATLLINGQIIEVKKDHNLTLDAGTMVCFLKGNGKVIINNKKQLDSMTADCHQIPVKDDFDIKKFLSSIKNKVVVSSIDRKQENATSSSRGASSVVSPEPKPDGVVYSIAPEETSGKISISSSDKEFIVYDETYGPLPVTLSIKKPDGSIMKEIINEDNSKTFFRVPTAYLKNKSKIIITNAFGNKLLNKQVTIDSTSKSEEKHNQVLKKLQKRQAHQRREANQLSRGMTSNFSASTTYLEDISKTDVTNTSGVRSIRSTSNEKHSKVFYEKDKHTIVDILYGTDRRSNYKKNDWENYYTGKRGKLKFGVAQVSIPKKHEFGKMERPNKYLFWQKEKIGEHVIVTKLENINKETFHKLLKSKLNNVEEKDILLFIHGFNVTFASAIRRTAQISYDLDFKGVPMTYSWPSEGKERKYMKDESSVQYTVPQLVEFLKEVIDTKGEANLHLLGHSMGTRALTNALKEISFTYKGKHPFKNIILAAPDIDKDVFEVSLLPYIIKTTDQITLYASSTDAALKFSKTLHGEERIGLGGDDIIVFKGLDTIDATGIDTSLVGHSYFAEKEILMKDLKDVIQKSLPPSKRDSLIEKIKEQLAYWKFRLDNL